jgi:hypothetical protein
MIMEESSMDTRTARALATAGALTLTLLAGCGGSPAPSTSSAPGVPASAAPSTSPATTTTPSAEPADATARVKQASETFVDEALTLSYAEGTGDAYASRVKPLMTDHGYDQLSSLLTQVTGQARSRFGKDARSRPQILGGTKVNSLDADKATTTVNFKPRVQQRKDGKWKTVKAASVDEVAKLSLVKVDDRWLVDKME